MIDAYTQVKTRRNGSVLYRCKQHTHYMKIGTHEDIAHEVGLYSKLHKAGFPLPKLIAHEINAQSLSWMKEELIEGDLYADIFRESTNTTGTISDEFFQQYLDYQISHFFAQAAFDYTSLSLTTFSSYEHLYHEQEIDTELIDSVLEKIDTTLSVLPTVRNHGDHNPYNIFTQGVIDLEDGFGGPLGYDAITGLTQNFWFPPADSSIGELHREHSFSEEQTHLYLQQLQQSYRELGITISQWSDIFGALFLMRGIFVTVKSNEFPQLKKYRYERLKKSFDSFLLGEDMISHYNTNF